MSEQMREGLDNLLFKCIGAEAGESLALISERGVGGYFSATLDAVIAAHARDRFLKVTTVVAPVLEDASVFPRNVRDAIEHADHSLFIARLGDQVRFSEFSHSGSTTMCYALDESCFETPFCTADYEFFVNFKSLIDQTVFGGRSVTIKCPSGTLLSGTSPENLGEEGSAEVTVRRFPLNVFRPVPAGTFSGQIALTKWLCPTGSRIYEPDGTLIDGVVIAQVDEGRIVNFEGERSAVKNVREHYELVAKKFDLDTYAIHSWHAGIHPHNGYDGLAIDDLTRWSGSAFGNPRYLHFHSCGKNPPGEICMSVFDPTVEVDGVDIWRDGRLVFGDSPAARELQSNYPGIRKLFDDPVNDFGLS